MLDFPQPGTYAYLLCDEHCSGTEEEIGMKAEHELREHIEKWHHATPTF
jgi:hypothetical protein